MLLKLRNLMTYLVALGGEPKLSHALLLFFGLVLFLPQAANAQSADLTNRFLLQAAAPNRAVGPDDRPNILFIIFRSAMN